MRVLFVCTGNTCRSPMAEGYLKSLGVYCESRGLSATGAPASVNAATVMEEIGIDIKNHISKPLAENDIKNFDRIICLAKSHYDCISSLGIECEILGDGISDPYGCGTDVYRNCRDQIIRAVDRLLKNNTVFEMQERHIEDVIDIENICFSHPWSKQSIIDAKNNHTRFFVFEKDGRAVGYVGVSAILDEGYITNIAVLPEYRKQGVATALFTKLDDFANENKLSFISLEVRKNNQNAISLYEKFGYKTEGVRKNFYDAPKEDAYIMTKRF